MGVVKGAIAIRDNATAVIKGIRTEQTAFRKDVVTTRKELERTWDKKHKAQIDSSAATRQMQKLGKTIEPFKKKLVKVVAIKDIATSKIKAVGTKLGLLDKKTAKPTVKLNNGLASGISKAKSMLSSAFKTVVVPVVATVTATSLILGGAVKSGMELEQQQVSMEHFISATNKGMSESEVKKAAAVFSNELRINSNETPFETGEVMAAGSRAIAISSGNTKEAMGLIKLSEDMAAASGGTKSLSDAIEALADAKLGEMERLKEFGFKVSAEEFNTKGFAGVSAELEGFFGGAAQKLATTGAGLMSTIKGKLKSNFSDFGLQVVDKLKPVFDGVIALIDKSAPHIEKFSTMLAGGIGDGIESAIAFIPSLVSGFNAIKPVLMSLEQAIAPVIGVMTAVVQNVLPSLLPVLQTVFTTVGTVLGDAAPLIAGVVSGIGTAVSTFAPVISMICEVVGEKIGTIASFLGEKMGFIQELFDTTFPFIAEIATTAWGVLSPVIDVMIGAFKLVFNVVQAVFPGIQKIISTVWNFVKPLIEGIGTVFKGIASGFNWVADKVSGGISGGDVGANADGTNNWRGGLTWVGEKGPELIDLPKGSRVLPNKESVAFSKSESNQGGYEVPKSARSPVGGFAQQAGRALSVQIAKLADTIVVREDADIDKLGTVLADKIVKVALNMP